MSSRVQLNWINPNNSGDVFIYKSTSPFTANNLPDIYEIIKDVSIVTYNDDYVKEGESYFYMFAVGVGANRVFSELLSVDILYSENAPYGLSCVVDDGDLLCSWSYDRILTRDFKIHVSDSPIDEITASNSVVGTSSSLLFNLANYDKHKKKYVRVSILNGNVEYFSNEVIVYSDFPYDIGFDLSSSGLRVEWNFDFAIYEEFKVYLSDQEIDFDDLPTPIENVQDTFYLIEQFDDIDLKKYICISVVVDGVEYFSKMHSFYAMPYNINSMYQFGVHVVEWTIEHNLSSSFNYYVSNTYFDESNKPTAMISGATSQLVIDDISPEKGKRYIRIGAVIDDVEYLSDVFIDGFDKPYAVESQLVNNKIKINWLYDVEEQVDVCNIYASDFPLNPNHLPSPVYSGAYIDNHTFDYLRRYNKKYVRIGVVVDGVEHVSEEHLFHQNRIYDFGVGLFGKNLVAMWMCDIQGVTSYSLYHKETDIDLDDLPVPIAENINNLTYVLSGFDIGVDHYFRVCAHTLDGDVFSDQFKYKCLFPYSLNVQINNNTLVADWSFNQVFDQGFSIYCDESEFTAESVPTPISVGVSQKNYTNNQISEYGRKYIAVGIEKWGNLFLSDVFTYRYSNPYGLVVDVLEENFTASWSSDYQDGEFIEYRLYSSPSLDVDDLPIPVYTGNLKEFDLGGLGVYGAKSFLVGLVLDDGVVFSDQFIYRYKYPYNLQTSGSNRNITITWSCDYDDVSFNYYVSDESMDIEDMPSPLATSIIENIYLDTVSDFSLGKYIRIGLVVDDVEYISEEVHVQQGVYFSPPYNVSGVWDNINQSVALTWDFDE